MIDFLFGDVISCVHMNGPFNRDGSTSSFPPVSIIEVKSKLFSMYVQIINLTYPKSM